MFIPVLFIMVKKMENSLRVQRQGMGWAEENICIVMAYDIAFRDDIYEELVIT